MKLVPIEKLTDDQWEQAWNVMYSLKLARHMGNDTWIQKPDLLSFYNNIMDAVEAGRFKAWGVIDEYGDYHGHTVLDKSTGEWEMGTVLANEELWSSGIGVRAAAYAMRWAFEEDGANWVIVFTNGRDPRVHSMVERAGFEKFMHFRVMSKRTWNERWKDRVDRIVRGLDAQEA